VRIRMGIEERSPRADVVLFLSGRPGSKRPLDLRKVRPVARTVREGSRHANRREREPGSPGSPEVPTL